MVTIMKKLLAFLLASVCFFLCACYNGNSDEDATDNSKQPIVSIDYESIERYHPSDYNTLYWGNKEDDTILSVICPKEWSFVKGDGHTDVMRDGNTIGKVFSGEAADAEQWSELKKESSSSNNCEITMFIESNGSLVRYRYVFNYSVGKASRTTTLVAECSEIDQYLEYKLLISSDAVKKHQSDTLGVLSKLKDPKNILILGNSFVGSSNIGAILREMLSLNGKSCYVNAISRGYATVDTYINDPGIESSIKSGDYDAVFICGLYSAQEVPNLGILKSFCDVSKTPLIIFPAHNENESAINSAKSKYPSLVCLNWRSELNKLIRNGVDRWDLCVNDMHYHSTPLAGYIGAHMIYRAIYGELPKKAIQNSINQSYVDSILGDYAYKGDIEIIDNSKIIYIN